MNHSTIKIFNSSRSQVSKDVARSPSPPISIPEAGPIQVDQVDASEVLVTGRKSYGAAVYGGMNGSLVAAQGHSGSLDQGIPTLEPAMETGPSMRQSMGLSSSQLHYLPSASEGASPLLVSLTPVQRLEEREKHFPSPEITAEIPHQKLFRCCSKRGHTWKRTIFVNVFKRKEVKVYASLYPKVQDADGLENTNLHITANVHSKLLTKLRGCGMKCSVIVNTNVMDLSAGKSLHRTEGTRHPINVDDGQVNFSQVLVPYKQTNSCTRKHVTLLIKVIFVTAPNAYPNLKDEREEDGFTMIDKE